MASALEAFLIRVERRAFITARIATGNEDDALDLVQTAMTRLVEKYADKPAEEWPPLFQRILQSCISDWYRRQKVRNRWRVWLKHDNDDGIDPLENEPGIDPALPCDLAGEWAFGEALEQSLTALPLRQKQVFLLRAWEGCNVAETARIMQCSEGSVKTHYFRALQKLREQLQEHRDE